MLSTNSSLGRPFKGNTIAAHIVLMGKIYRWRADELDVDTPPPPFTTKVLPKGWDAGRERRLLRLEENALIQETKRVQRPYRYHWRLLIRLAIETGARQALDAMEGRGQIKLISAWDLDKTAPKDKAIIAGSRSELPRSTSWSGAA